MVPRHRIYRFGDCELDEARFELRRGGRDLELQPRPLELLRYLIRRRDRVVGKQELMDALWSDTVVSDAALSSALKDLRRALGDAGSRQRFVQTLRGRGYRFVADVEVSERPLAGREAEPGEIPFVGRVDLVRRLESALGAAKQGRGGAVVLCGEAGIGKTRTASRVAATAREQGFEVVRAGCHEGEGVPPYWLWVQTLRAVAERWSPASLSTELGPKAMRLAPLLPEIASGAADPVAARDEPETGRFRLFDALSGALEISAGRAPLLLLLEDLHWADAESLAALDFVLERLRGVPVLLLGTCRDEEVDRLHPLVATLASVARHDWCQRLTLGGLGDDEVGELIEHLIGARPPARVVATILEKTDGNPFFVKEWASLLAERTRGEAISFDLSSFEVPPGVRDVIRGRLGGLSEVAVRVLEAGSVVGREFDLDLVAGVTAVEAGRLGEALEEARRAGLVAEPRRGHCSFSHALVQETLYLEQDTGHRAGLHGRLGEAIEKRHGADVVSHLAELARHFARGAEGGRAEVLKAIDYARRAGEHARTLLAFEAADAHYAQALELLERLTEPDDERRFELLLAQGEARAWLDRGASASILERAEEVARRLGDGERFARAVLEHSWGVAAVDPDPPMQARLREALDRLGDDASRLRVDLLRCLAGLLYIDRNFAEADELLVRGIALARELGDDAALAPIEFTRLLQRAPRTPPADTLAAADRSLLARLRSHPLGGRVFELRLRSLLALGDLKGADHEAEDLARYVRVQHSVRGEMFLRWYRASRALLAGEAGRAERLATDARLVAERHLGTQTALATWFVQLLLIRRHQGRLEEIESMARAIAEGGAPGYAVLPALVYAEHDRLDEARQQLDYLLARTKLAELPFDDLRISGYAMVADVCAEVRHTEACRIIYEQMLPHEHQNAIVGYALLVWEPVDHCLGKLADALEMWTEAERHFDAALEGIRGMGTPALGARAQLDCARMLERRGAPGDRPRALELAQQALAAARELDMKGLAKKAESLLDLATRGGAGT